MKPAYFWPSLMATVLVSACGGGDSSTSSAPSVPTAMVQITSANATSVAKGAVTPAQGMTQASSGTAGVIGVVAQPSGRSHSVLDISLAKFAQVRGMQLAPASGVVGAIAGLPLTLTCASGGTQTISAQDNNNNGTFDAGDVLTISASNCNDGIATSNGSMTFAVTALSGAMGGTGTASSPLTAAFKVTFSQYSTKDNATSATDTINGDIGFSTSDDGTNTTGTMSGTSLSMTSSVDGTFQMTNYAVSFTEANFPTSTTPYSFTFNMTVASTVANGSVVITTPTAFTGAGTGDPTAGVMVITGANNSTLTLTASPDGINVGMVVDEDGAAGPMAPVTLPSTTWANL